MENHKCDRIALIALCFSILVSMSVCSHAWADGAEQPGGQSSGSGTVEPCSTSYGSVHEPICNEGKNGGGKSWRIYRISNGTIAGLNKGADWKIVEGDPTVGGNFLSKDGGILPQCASEGAPYLIVLGLNRVVTGGQDKKFYVVFDQQEVKGPNSDKCRNNKGCYYNPNTWKHATKNQILTNTFSNGQTVTNGTVKDLYEDDFGQISDSAFKKVGAFCSWAGKKTLIAYAKDFKSDAYLNSGNAISASTVAYNGAATVNNINLNEKGYTFVKWDRDNSTASSLTVSPMTEDITVNALYNPFEATSSLSAKVSNKSVASYSNASSEVYAKPSDETTFSIDYTPSAQGGCNLKPDTISINGGAAANINNTASILQSLFKTYNGSKNWSNVLNVLGSNYTPGESRLVYSNCQTDRKTRTEDYTIRGSDVGESLTETVKTEGKDGSGSTITPTEVKIGVASNKIVGYVNYGLESSATIKVPYNFENTTEITGLNNGSNVVYAGETSTVNLNIDVHTRTNNTLQDTYATIVRNAKWRLGVSASRGGPYQWSEIKSGDLNSSYNLKSTIPNTDIASRDSKTIPVNIPDVRAGSEVCFKSAVFPDNSVTDLQMESAYRGASWAESGETCFTVAKRPSLQIWGGNVFSSGSIETGLAIKNNLAGISGAEYNPNQGHGPFVFGSWGELGVISMGKVTGFTSGASTGYAGLDKKVLTPNPFATNPLGSTPGGGNTDNFVNLSSLTFANTSDGINSVTGTGDINNARSISDDHSLLESFVSSFSTEEATTVTLDNNAIVSIAPDAQDDGVVQYRNDAGDLEVSAITLGANSIKVISAKNIKVSGNITYYGGDEGFVSLIRVPKVLLYASDTISINCDVTHLDAVLVASNVITCGDSLANETETLKSLNDRAKANINKEKNSKQLYINGAVITNNLIANRTYGAATGSNSIVPAEIINFDPTLYLWTGNSAGISDNGSTINADLEITYSHELAPRR